MIDVGGGYLDIPAVETAGFKMIDVGTASILSNRFSTARNTLNYIFWFRYIKDDFLHEYLNFWVWMSNFAPQFKNKIAYWILELGID